MIIFSKRHELFRLAKDVYRIPKVYDLLEIIKASTDNAPASTDGINIFVNPDMFNAYSAESQFFILCHEMLHILYHHTDPEYFPKDIYENHALLNICQDVVINEYLKSKLCYRESTGIYLDNLSDILLKRGFIGYPLCYYGDLTTRDLYDKIISIMDRRADQMGEDKMDDLNNALDDLSDKITDKKDMPEERPQDLQQKLNDSKIDNAMNEMKKKLKITDEQINEETKDRVAVTMGGMGDSVTTTNTIKTIDYKDMIKYIEQFIGHEAVIKERHRTFTRPSRRINLSNGMVAAGYKNSKIVNKIQVYLDVSGSMNPMLVSNLFGVLKKLYSKVTFDFYTFNHYIQKIDMASTDVIYTNGGTDIQAVLDTIASQKQDAAILITDCNDNFSLKNVDYNLMIYTNNRRFTSDNKKVSLTYFN